MSSVHVKRETFIITVTLNKVFLPLLHSLCVSEFQTDTAVNKKQKLDFFLHQRRYICFSCAVASWSFHKPSAGAADGSMWRFSAPLSLNAEAAATQQTQCDSSTFLFPAAADTLTPSARSHFQFPVCSSGRTSPRVPPLTKHHISGLRKPQASLHRRWQMRLKWAGKKPRV